MTRCTDERGIGLVIPHRQQAHGVCGIGEDRRRKRVLRDGLLHDDRIERGDRLFEGLLSDSAPVEAVSARGEGEAHDAVSVGAVDGLQEGERVKRRAQTGMPKAQQVHALFLIPGDPGVRVHLESSHPALRARSTEYIGRLTRRGRVAPSVRRGNASSRGAPVERSARASSGADVQDALPLQFGSCILSEVVTVTGRIADASSTERRAVKGERMGPSGGQIVKRLMDLAVSAIGFLALAVPFAVIAAAIKLDSPGPVFFRQVRVGRGGARFRVWKFRTMTETRVDPNAPDRLGPDDARITRVGRVLRGFGLDELPQLLNVLRGSMSLVGPRPTLAYQVERYDAFQRRRLEATPGSRASRSSPAGTPSPGSGGSSSMSGTSITGRSGSICEFSPGRCGRS